MVYNQPLVSVCIPTYNAGKTVRSTLQSILNQTYHNLEILVVDNLSTDDTLSLLQQINDPRLVIYKNERNIGAEANFSKCIGLASGEYTAIFHADDLYQPNMVEKQVQAFQTNSTIGAAFTLANHINDRGELTGEDILPTELKGKGIYYFPEIFISLLGNTNFLVCPSAMVRSEIYKELAPFNDEWFRTSADLDMWLRILEKHPIAILDERLMSRRLSKGQGSYRYSYLRTEEADFFKVMDYYLSVKSEMLDIPDGALNKYGFLRNIDKIGCARSYLIKGQPQEAKKLLRESFSASTFRGAIHSIRKPKLLAYWLFGIMLLGLVYLGLGRYLRKSMYWLRYGRRRFI